MKISDTSVNIMTTIHMTYILLKTNKQISLKQHPHKLWPIASTLSLYFIIRLTE